MKIVIPSYNRVEVLKNTTYKNLIDAGFSDDEINIFVANQEQYNLYKPEFTNCNIIIGVLGIQNIRNFIQDYYDDGELLLSFDDDLKEFVFKNPSDLKTEIFKMRDELMSSPYSLIGVNPTGNKYFMRPDKDGNMIRSGLYFCVGCCFMWKNDKSIRVSGFLDDYERSLFNFVKYGKVLRNDNLSFKTKYYADGGIGKRSLEDYTAEVNRLNKSFSKFTRIKTKSNKSNLKNFGVEKIPHLLLRENKGNVDEPEFDLTIDKLPPITKEDIEALYNEFKNNVKIPYESSVKRFGKTKRMCFGIVFDRIKKIERPAKSNTTHSKAFELLNEYAKKFVPFQYKTIQVNHNVVCPRHIDPNNNGKSYIVSFGEYEGCKLFINDVEYDAFLQPIMFNGALLEHYNSNDLVGDKYSVVFYK